MMSSLKGATCEGRCFNGNVDEDMEDGGTVKLPFLNDAVSCGGKCVDWRDSSVACRVRYPRGV